QSEELLTLKLAPEARAEEARSLRDLLKRLTQAVQHRPGHPIKIPPDLLQELRVAERQASQLYDRLSADQQFSVKVVDSMLQELRHVRMVPLATVLDVLVPMVRDIAREEGKQVDLKIEGA